MLDPCGLAWIAAKTLQDLTLCSKADHCPKSAYIWQVTEVSLTI